MFNSDGQRKDFPLKEGKLTVGRKNTCGLRIPLSSVSREHFRIEQEDDALKLRDLGSSNGTFYNGERVQEAELQPGDQIRVGPVTFIVVIDGKPEQLEPVRTVLPSSAGGEVESGEPAQPPAEPVPEREPEPQPAASPAAQPEAPAAQAPADASDQTPEQPEAIESADEMPAKVEDESRTPTVDFDEDEEDPIAALEALAAAGSDEDDEEPIPFIEDEDEDEQEQSGQRQRSQ